MAIDRDFMVRVATTADSQGLARLRYQWRTQEREEPGLGEPSFERELVVWMETHRYTHFPFLATRKGEPIGMAWLAVVDRVPGPEHFTRRSAYIQSVYVIPGERSRGIGTRLMELVLVHARDLGLDYIAVHPSDRAFSLYSRLGFAATDRVLELRP